MRIFGLAVVLGLAGCATDPVTLDLNFPSNETFLHSEQARIVVFDVGPGGLGDCPVLLGEVLAGAPFIPPIHDTGRVSVCNFRNGGVTVGAPAEGPLAWIAVIEDASNTPLLTGCTIAEVYADAPAILIHLYPTDEYRTAVTGPPRDSSIEAKCSR
jgi:hypothetical protein